jgi:transposase
MTMSRAEVITSVERRRRWSRQDKERLVAASFEPGASVSEVARAAGLHVSQLFRWRKELCKRSEASVAPLVPVEIIPSLRAREAEEPSSPSAPARRRKNEGIIEIELVDGHRVRVDCDVDGDAPRAVSGGTRALHVK